MLMHKKLVRFPKDETYTGDMETVLRMLSTRFEGWQYIDDDGDKHEIIGFKLLNHEEAHKACRYAEIYFQSQEVEHD